MQLPLWARVLFRVRACARRPRATRHPPRERPSPSAPGPLCTQLVARSPVSSPALVRLCLAERSLALLVLPPQLSHVAL